MFWTVTGIGLIAINVVLQGLDIWTTLEALEAGAREQNAVSRAVMENFGIPAWVVLKGMIVVVLVACGWWLRGEDEGSAQRLSLALAVIAVWMSFVIAGNFQVLAGL